MDEIGSSNLNCSRRLVSRLFCRMGLIFLACLLLWGFAAPPAEAGYRPTGKKEISAQHKKKLLRLKKRLSPRHKRKLAKKTRASDAQPAPRTKEKGGAPQCNNYFCNWTYADQVMYIMAEDPRGSHWYATGEAFYDDAFVVYDICNPARPRVSWNNHYFYYPNPNTDIRFWHFFGNSLSVRDIPGHGTVVALSGIRNYHQGEVIFVDVNSPSQPVIISTLTLGDVDSWGASGGVSGAFVADNLYLVVVNLADSEAARAMLVDLSNLSAPQLVQDIALPAPEFVGGQGETIVDKMATRCILQPDQRGLVCSGLRTIKGVRVTEANQLDGWSSVVFQSMVYRSGQENLYTNALLIEGNALYLARSIDDTQPAGVYVFSWEHSMAAMGLRQFMQIHPRGNRWGDRGSSLILLESRAKSGRQIKYLFAHLSPDLGLAGRWVRIYLIGADGTLSPAAESAIGDNHYGGFGKAGGKLYAFDGMGSRYYDISNPLSPALIGNVMQCDPLYNERGDVNCDGLRNFNDIDPFILALSLPVQYEQLYPQCFAGYADMNQDGLITPDDIDPFIGVLGH